MVCFFLYKDTFLLVFAIQNLYGFMFVKYFNTVFNMFVIFIFAPRNQPIVMRSAPK